MTDERQYPEDLAAAYALDALDADDRLRFEASMAGSPRLQAEVAAYREVVAHLGLGVEPVRPPDRLRAEVLRRARTAPPAGTTAAGPARSVAYDALEWEDGGVPGLLLHWIRRDSGTGDSVVLMRGEPGTKYPDHRHTSEEHGFVLQGAFRDALGEYRRGDYIHYPAGSAHRDIHVTSSGVCIFLVITGPIIPLDDLVATV